MTVRSEEAVSLAENPAPSPVSVPGTRNGGIRFTSNVVGPVIFLVDVICLTISGLAALLLYDVFVGQRLLLSVHVFAFTVVAVSFLLIRSSRRSYRRALADLHEEGEVVLDGVLCSLLASAIIWQFGMIENYSRGASLLFLACFVLCLLASRPATKLLLKALAGGGSIEQRVAFYGADPRSIEMIHRLTAMLDLPHLKLVGVADDRPKVADRGSLKFLGGYEALARLARAGGLDQVIIVAPHIPKERLGEIVDGLSAVSVDVSLLPSDAIELAPNYRVYLLGSIPVLGLWQRPFRDINQFVKRGEDLIIASIAVALLSPIIALAAIMVRATSPGPALFVQPRIGFNNEVIHVFKFRTMYVDQTDIGARATTSRDDPRVTPVGRVLRKFSIDELPQLFNVLRGDMSLVGPRPHALEMKVGDRHYQDAVRGYAGRHRVRPGMTGLAQVKGLRGEIRTVERAKRRVELDRYYIEHWSVWLDLKIMAGTFRAVLFDHDAY